MKKILITGSSGLLGSSLTRRLNNKVYKIFKFKRNKEFDLSKYNFCLNFLKKNNFYAIVNLSAITNIDNCEKNHRIAKKVNYIIVKNLCRSINSLNLKTYLIQFSTDQFYNDFNKNSEIVKKYKNYYTKTKLLAEGECLNSNAIILRTNFSGKSLSRGRSSFSDWIYDNLSKNIKIKLADDIFFSPLSIQTLCSIIKIILKKKVKGIFNVGSKKGYSKYIFGFKFAKKLNLDTNLIKKVNYKDIKFFANRNKDMRMVLKKFENKFKYKFNSLDHELLKISNDYKRKNKL
jgi:dTDP-4-dehydrorhamnose reductase